LPKLRPGDRPVEFADSISATHTPAFRAFPAGFRYSGEACPLLTRASIAPYALDAWPGVAFAALCWTAAYAAAAGTLFGLPLLTFDG
jgi:hypothetical protein